MNQVDKILAHAKQEMSDLKDLIRKDEAAAKLRVSTRTIERMAAKGVLTKFEVIDKTSVKFSANQIACLFHKKPEYKPEPIKTTFSKYTTNQKAAPVFPPAFGGTIEVTLPDSSVVLSATGCYDPTNPTGEVKSFNWEKMKGSPTMGMLRTPAEISTEFVSLVVGDYKMKLTLTGSTGVSVSKDFVVKVKMPAKPKPSDPAALPDPSMAGPPPAGVSQSQWEAHRAKYGLTSQEKPKEKLKFKYGFNIHINKL
ncbi:MAG TPA: hypothetical protein VK489_05835 [Ferruginibacter sp.]|nr:hypothetical protein [Ferruginibacter sp.]